MLNTQPNQHSGTPGPFPLTLEALLYCHRTSDRALQPHPRRGQPLAWLRSGGRAYNNMFSQVHVGHLLPTMGQVTGRGWRSILSSPESRVALEGSKLLLRLSENGYWRAGMASKSHLYYTACPDLVACSPLLISQSQDILPQFVRYFISFSSLF